MGDERGKQVGGGITVALGIVVVWFLGHVGVSMSAEVGAAIGAVIIIVFAAIWDEGIMGVFHHLLHGRAHGGHAISERTGKGKVVVKEPDPPQDQ